MQQARVLHEARRIYFVDYSLRCSNRLLPLILRPLSVMAATPHWRRKKKNGSAGERKKNQSGFLSD